MIKKLPSSLSLAEVVLSNDADPIPLITAAKMSATAAGDVIFHVYQSTNKEISINLFVNEHIGGNPLKVRVTSALADQTPYARKPGDNSVRFTAPYALTTLS